MGLFFKKAMSKSRRDCPIIFIETFYNFYYFKTVSFGRYCEVWNIILKQFAICCPASVLNLAFVLAYYSKLTSTTILATELLKIKHISSPLNNIIFQFLPLAPEICFVSLDENEMKSCLITVAETLKTIHYLVFAPLTW